MQPIKLGVLGAGQLGRMLGLAGIPLGIECVFLGGDAGSPASAVGSVVGESFDDAAAVAKLAGYCDAVTPEIENISIDALQAAQDKLRPGLAAVATAQDRLDEKTLFATLGIPTAPYVRVDSARDLATVQSRLDWPVVLKSRRLGYDGRGQRVCRSLQDLELAWEQLQAVPSIAEGWVDFETEVSLIAARSVSGEEAFYPLSENTHRDGILATTVAPFENAAATHQAHTWLSAILRHFDYVGVLTVEFFLTRDGLVANEMAPRVHNSGHWTIEGAQTSQFENHLRAVLDMPLGSADPTGHAAMVNLIGTIADRRGILATPGAHLHDYGKSPRKGRKLGHCTLVDGDRQRLLSRLEVLLGRLNP